MAIDPKIARSGGHGEWSSVRLTANHLICMVGPGGSIYSDAATMAHLYTNHRARPEVAAAD